MTISATEPDWIWRALNHRFWSTVTQTGIHLNTRVLATSPRAMSSLARPNRSALTADSPCENK